MTIRSTRQAALSVGFIGAIATVAFGISALVFGQPRFFYLLGFLVLAVLFAVVRLLVPMTLSLEGDQLLYSSGPRTRRSARSEVTGCKQVGTSWVFSDAAGAQLLVLPGIRFKDADVVAFCNQAGIALTAASQRPVDKLRRDMRTAKGNRAFGLGLGVILLAATAGLVYVQLHAQDNLSRYRAAPACADALPATTSCRLQTQARVTSVEPHSTFTTLHVTLVKFGGDYGFAYDHPGPKTGDVVDVELWNGEVTRLSGQDTEYNPALDPNAHLNGLLAVPLLFALICLGVAGYGQYVVMSSTAKLRVAASAEIGTAGPVYQVHPDAAIAGLELPPCGVMHQPKEQFFAHVDPKAERQGVAILLVLAVIVLAVLLPLAFLVSAPIFGGIAVLGLAWLALELYGESREHRIGGIYADDLHVAKITTMFGRVVRKVFPRSAVLEVSIGTRINIVGTNGSTLFYSGMISGEDMERYAAFLGCRVVRDTPPAQPDSIATPPVRTSMGVLPLRVRRAAGIMQTIGALLVVLGVVNVIRLSSTPADRRAIAIGLLASLVVYGLILYGLGLMLARGLPRARELTLAIGGATTAAFLVSTALFTGTLVFSAIFAVLLLSIYGVTVYLLRDADLGRSRDQ